MCALHRSKPNSPTRRHLTTVCLLQTQAKALATQRAQHLEQMNRLRHEMEKEHWDADVDKYIDQAIIECDMEEKVEHLEEILEANLHEMGRLRQLLVQREQELAGYRHAFGFGY